MAAMTAEALIKRAEKAKARRDRMVPLYRDAYDFAMPERQSFRQQSEGTQDKSQKVYDSTAVVAVSRFANRLQQALCPPAQRWATLAPGGKLQEAEKERVADTLGQATEMLFQHIHRSNFDTAFNEAAHDLAAGTMVLLVENGRLGGRPTDPLLRFSAMPASAVAIDEGPQGLVEGVFHTHTIPARLVERTYPDATELPREISEKARTEPDADVSILQCTTFDAADAVWRFQAVHETSKAIIVERRTRTSPWVVVRWIKAPGEVWGRGPLVQALPDIRTANKVVELVLKNASIAVTGIWQADDDGVLNPATVKLVPGAIIPKAVGSSGLTPLAAPGEFDVSQLILDQLQTRIRTVMFDNPLPPEVMRGVTATEVVERIRQFSQDTGAFGRLNQDGVVPIVLRCLDIMDEAGELPGLTALIDEEAIRIMPVSPLAQAQNLADVRTVTDFLTLAGGVGPDFAMAGIKVADAGAFVAEKLGVPSNLRPTELERQQAAQMQQQQAEAQTLATSPVVARAVPELLKMAGGNAA